MIFLSPFENIYITHALSRGYKLGVSFFLSSFVREKECESSNRVSAPPPRCQSVESLHIFFYSKEVNKVQNKSSLSLARDGPSYWISQPALLMSCQMILQEDSTQVKEHCRGTLGGFAGSLIKFNWD